jgi:phosphoglycolate phosphatase-like HAD superfamily hydrolase
MPGGQIGRVRPTGRRALGSADAQAADAVLATVQRYAPVALDAPYLAALAQLPVDEVRAVLADLDDAGRLRMMSRDRVRLVDGPVP